MSLPATLAAYFHTLDGTLLPISGPIAIRFYGVTYILGFVIAAWVLVRLAQRRLIAISAERVPDVMLLVVLGTLLGGRIGYIIFYETTPWTTRLANIYKVWDGGMASHGGMIGIILGCIVAARMVDLTLARGGNAEIPRRPRLARTLHVMDCMGLVACFGLFLGRIANFVNGELLGAIVSPPGTPGPWWTVQFPRELDGWEAPGVLAPGTHTPALTPAQLDQLDALVSSVQRPQDKWSDALHYITSHAAKFQPQLEPLLSSRHPSQLYQAIAEGIVLGIAVWFIWRFPRRPGVIAAWWLMIYGVLRILTELWRLPDPQFGAAMRIAGLSRGQWLSVAMIAGGALVLWLAHTARGPRIGGWLRPNLESPSTPPTLVPKEPAS
ncbi:hypothetical protein BH11PLA1_BH11PLA1_15280 [soil metagenome]